MDLKVFFDAVSHKHILGIIFASMCVLEIRNGFLKPLKQYVKQLSLKPFIFIKAIAFTSAFCLLFFDVPLIAKIQSYQFPLLDRIITFGAFWGKAHGAWGPLAALYFLALIFRFKKAQDLFFGAVLSSALTGLVSYILKFMMMRARPYNDLGPFHFFDLQGFMRDDRAFQSFPSGDVAIAAGAAAFLFLSLKRFYFSWVFLLIPVLTALSRMDLNKHWPSDTAFSFLISFAVAKFTLDYFSYSRNLKIQ